MSSAPSDPLRPPAYWKEATEALSALDPVMASLIERYPGGSLGSRDDAFHTLARAIVGQQISVKAADSVWARLVGCVVAVAPAAVLSVQAEELRSCGLSARKVEYLVDLAQHFVDGRVRVDRWASLDDASLIAELVAVRGIGVWTAEMFLIFHEMRPDVFPLDDIGLQKAVAEHYLEGERPSRKRLVAVGERWRPWRSVATWYLWRSLDPVPVEY
jgi:DNA-3-methyladenine glycosylase II